MSLETTTEEDIPEGGYQVAEDVIMYETNKGHSYLHLPTRLWMKGFTRVLGNLQKGEGLTRWIANQGGYEQYLAALEDAANRGTAVHQGIEELLGGLIVKRSEFRPDAYQHLRTWVNFYEDFHPETLAVEECLYDIRRKICTKMDYRGLVGKNIKSVNERIHAVLDWKTSSGIWDSAKLQVNEEVWTYNSKQEFDEHGHLEGCGVVRTGTKHKRGYEYWFFDTEEERQIHEYRHKIFNCLLWLEHFNDPEWQPTFPEEIPRELFLDDIEDSEMLNGDV